MSAGPAVASGVYFGEYDTVAYAEDCEEAKANNLPRPAPERSWVCFGEAFSPCNNICMVNPRTKVHSENSQAAMIDRDNTHRESEYKEKMANFGSPVLNVVSVPCLLLRMVTGDAHCCLCMMAWLTQSLYIDMMCTLPPQSCLLCRRVAGPTVAWIAHVPMRRCATSGT